MQEPTRPVVPPPAAAAPALTPTQTRAAAAAADKAHKAELADAKQKKLQALADKQKADQAARAAAAEAAPKPAIKLASSNAAPRIAAPPASSGGTSEAFSSRPIAGGAPAFPADDDYVGKAGQVTVNCRIQEDGRPAGCSVVAARGGPAFKSAVLRWLNSGRVRYAPIIHNGQPVSETHQWSVQFQGD
jgi:TonB family protein